MSMVVNIETLKSVIEGLEPYGTAAVDVSTGDSMLAQTANEIDEYRKVLETHKSTEQMAQNLEPLSKRIKMDTVIIRDVVETLTKIVESIELHERKATAAIQGTGESK